MAQGNLTRSLTSTATAVDHVEVEGVGRAYPDRRVLTDVSFTVARGARAGLIGENGSGKSTLLRIIAGRDEPDTGVVRTPARVGLLWQELPFEPADRVGDVLDDAIAEAATAERDVELAAAAVAAGEPDAAARLEQALADADRTDAWSTSARRGAVVAGLGLAAVDERRTVAELSGGQRSRLALAALLLARPTALLLDEPTNHLDDEAVAFLHRALVGWAGPVLFASHDRAFLDETATRILDLDPTPLPFELVVPGADGGSGYGVQAFRGDYTDYLAQRRQQREQWQRRYEAEQDELRDLRHEVAVTARTTNRKSTARTEGGAAKKFSADRDAKVTSRRVRNAAVRLAGREREQVRKPPAELAFAGVPGAPLHGSPGPLVTATEVAVTGRLRATTVSVPAGGKLLVTGGNGAGKSTLLAVLHGDVDATSGSVQRALSVRTALLRQEVVFPDRSRSPRSVYEAAVGPARAEALPLSAMGLLSGRDLDRPLGSLSVGQQRRLALALVLASPPHVLLLDEPTNHLSLALAEDLEHALEAHAGAVVLASHDRWLRRRWEHETLDLGGV